MKNPRHFGIKLLVLTVLCILISTIFCGCCLKHDYVAKVTAPTCTEGGYTTYICSKCGDTKTSDFTEALGHDYAVTTVEPTCTDGGYTLYKCTRCGDSYTRDELPAHGHSYAVDQTVAPTCTEDGYTLMKCAACGDTYTTDRVDSLGHDLVSEIETEATCKQAGVMRYSCQRCDYTYTEPYSLPVLASEQIYEMAKKSVGEMRIYDKNGKALGLGTCFVIDENGTFVTNFHVVENAYSATITIDGQKLPVTSVLAYDKDIDLAIVQAATSAKLTPLSICRETLSGGETVYAVGSAEGLTLSFTTGVVSYPDRIVDSVHHVQHDASISSGNSGGPLFNVYGEVIGINTWSLVVGQNLNFAISTKELDNLSYSRPLTMEEFYKKFGPYFSVEVDQYQVSERESNGSLATAQEVTINGTTVVGSINRSSDIDVYKVTVAAGETLKVYIITEYTAHTEGIACGLVDANVNTLSVGSPTTFNSEPAIYFEYKNKTAYAQETYIIGYFYEDYEYKNSVANYRMFVYKKAPDADENTEFAYVNNKYGLKLKLPYGWSTPTSTSFIAIDGETGNSIMIEEGSYQDSTASEFIDATLEQLVSKYTAAGAVASRIGEIAPSKLGSVNCLMQKMTISANGVTVTQYYYFIEKDNCVLGVIIQIKDLTPVSTYEMMFS